MGGVGGVTLFIPLLLFVALLNSPLICLYACVCACVCMVGFSVDLDPDLYICRVTAVAASPLEGPRDLWGVETF